MIAESALEPLFMARESERTQNREVRPAERRKSRRAPLRWTVYVDGEDSMHPFRTETRDISKDSLYCVVNRPVTPGERITCNIALPTHSSVRTSEVVFLRCRAAVVRVEKTDVPGYFGVGCTIEGYHLVFGHFENAATPTESLSEA